MNKQSLFKNLPEHLVGAWLCIFHPWSHAAQQKGDTLNFFRGLNYIADRGMELSHALYKDRKSTSRTGEVRMRSRFKVCFKNIRWFTIKPLKTFDFRPKLINVRNQHQGVHESFQHRRYQRMGSIYGRREWFANKHVLQRIIDILGWSISIFK